MEDMARLAVVEQSVRDSEMFINILTEFSLHLKQILDNPHDYECRLLRNEILRKALQYESFADYVQHIGFKSDSCGFTYPKEQTLNNLRIALAALERKLYFCTSGNISKQSTSKVIVKKSKLTPAYILNTNNNLLLTIQNIYNEVLKYEDEELQAKARDHIPLVKLQLMAIDRMREHQRKIKAGEIKGHDLPFDMSLLMELLGWFKYSFFSWVDKPNCDSCGGPTILERTTTTTHETETCRLEIYKCTKCPTGSSTFPRYNNPGTLLRTRRGRCGEWANCFTLLCRSLGYDTRYVLDTTDHVWCEVFDYDSNCWLHVDPCEAKLNAPLIYSCGWKKRLSYVIAVSRDDLQDVTWRYTTNHKDVLKRRNTCNEAELICTIMSLREHRQRQVSEARRKYLAKRCLLELAQLMVEREPGDYESHGRISGSMEWRRQRGEIETQAKGHVFEFRETGAYAVRYSTATDKYQIFLDESELKTVDTWSEGVYDSENVFRKVEDDWRMVYLARQEGVSTGTGTISWRLAICGADLYFNSLCVTLSSALYETGNIDWTVSFDGEESVLAKLAEKPTHFYRQFKEVTITAELTGGVSDIAWQHAQLFRQSLDSKSCAFEILTTVEKKL